MKLKSVQRLVTQNQESFQLDSSEWLVTEFLGHSEDIPFPGDEEFVYQFVYYKMVCVDRSNLLEIQPGLLVLHHCDHLPSLCDYRGFYCGHVHAEHFQWGTRGEGWKDSDITLTTAR